MHERTALLTREDRGVELLGIVLLGENETGTRTAKSLVSRGGYDIGVRDRARVQSGCDKTREVCHINPELGSDFVGDFLHGLEVFDTRVALQPPMIMAGWVSSARWRMISGSMRKVSGLTP